MLLLINLSDAPLSMVLTSNDIAEELVRTMASAIGLVMAVPATTALAVLVVRSMQATSMPDGRLPHGSRPGSADNPPVLPVNLAETASNG